MRSGTAFERTVITIARNLWPSAEYSGAEMHDGRERDGIFVTEDVIHLLECTELRTKDKAEQDSQKLAGLANKYRRTNFETPVKCWLVTRDEPTADQRTVVKLQNYPVTILSLQQFNLVLLKPPNTYN